MNTKKLITLICLFALSLVLVSCGSPSLNDEEFTDTAREVCSTLKAEIASIDSLDITSRADAYRHAADALADLEITEQSAPQGYLLRSGLVELADSFDMFDKAFAEALTKANIDTPETVIFTEEGSVFAISMSTNDLSKLDIESALVLELNVNNALVREAAISLELEECAIEW